MLESSLQSENITYRPHVAHGCVKLQSKHIRNTYDRYTTIIIIITRGMQCIVGRACMRELYGAL